jgi:hypothetical protein
MEITMMNGIRTSAAATSRRRPACLMAFPDAGRPDGARSHGRRSGSHGAGEQSAAWSIDPQRVLVDVENGFHLAAVVRLHPRKRMIWRMIFAS